MQPELSTLLARHKIKRSHLNQHLVRLCERQEIEYDSVLSIPIQNTSVALNELFSSSILFHAYISSQGKVFKCLRGKRYTYANTKVLRAAIEGGIVNQKVYEAVKEEEIVDTVQPENEDELVTTIQPAMEQIRLSTGRIDINQDVEENPLWPIIRKSESSSVPTRSLARSLFSAIPGASSHFGF
jgi:hypothetical protein